MGDRFGKYPGSHSKSPRRKGRLKPVQRRIIFVDEGNLFSNEKNVLIQSEQWENITHTVIVLFTKRSQE